MPCLPKARYFFVFLHHDKKQYSSQSSLRICCRSCGDGPGSSARIQQHAVYPEHRQGFARLYPQAQYGRQPGVQPARREQQRTFHLYGDIGKLGGTQPLHLRSQGAGTQTQGAGKGLPTESTHGHPRQPAQPEASQPEATPESVDSQQS